MFSEYELLVNYKIVNKYIYLDEIVGCYGFVRNFYLLLFLVFYFVLKLLIEYRVIVNCMFVLKYIRV